MPSSSYFDGRSSRGFRLAFLWERSELIFEVPSEVNYKFRFLDLRPKRVFRLTRYETSETPLGLCLWGSWF